MDTVAAPDADRVLVFDRALFQCCQQALHIFDQDVAGAYQLYVETGVQYIRRSHALMHETCLFAAHMFGQMGQERDDVMFGFGLDFIDARNVKLNILGFPDGVGVFTGDHAQIGHRVTGVGFDFVPDFKFGFGRPDGNHFGAGIARDHLTAFIRSAFEARFSPLEPIEQANSAPP